jgi:hypothetical protein
VDDTDLVQANNYIELVLHNMQRKINLWNELVGVTGGILSPSKCWRYAMEFQYKKGQWKAVDSSADLQLWISDENKQRIPLTRCTASHGMNMLGVYMAPDGNQKDHIQELRRKAESWARNISDCNANREEIWTVLHRTIPFSIGYSLPAVTLSQSQCRYIIAPVYERGLPKAGISSTIPRAIQHGPWTMGGLDMMDPYLHMGVSQIESFVSNTWKQNPTGKLMEIALEDLELELGMYQPFDNHKLKIGLQFATTSSWIKHILTFMVEHGIHTTMGTPKWQPQRQRDRTIMDMALTSISHIPTLISINKIRMYMKVVWISDITMADGRHLDPRYLHHQETYPVHNNFCWPLKHSCTPQDWRRWCHWATAICGDQQMNLQSPLGHWICNSDRWIEWWDCFLSHDTEKLYRRTPDGKMWARHIKQQGRHHRATRFYSEFLLCNSLPEPPTQLFRTTVRQHQRYIEVICRSSIQHNADANLLTPLIQRPLLSTRHEILTRLHEILQPEFLDATRDINSLCHDFTQGTTIAVSDGSYFPATGTASGAWMIESACRSQWIMGSMTCQGQHQSFNSYRSELTGLLGIAVTIRVLANASPQPKHTIVGCDGEAALSVLTMAKEEMDANMSNADICSQLCSYNMDVSTHKTLHSPH